MADDLTRRAMKSEIDSEAAMVIQDLKRLSGMADQCAKMAAADDRTLGGEAYRIVQAASEVLRRASRLDGLRDFAKLID